MKCIDFITERDEELYNSYKEQMRKKNVRSHKQAVNEAIRSVTSRFWISVFQAYRGIRKIEKQGYAGYASPIKERMIRRIYDVYRELKNKPAFRGCSTLFIASFAVQQKAPEFYMSYSRAQAIIAKKRREAGRKRRHAEPF